LVIQSGDCSEAAPHGVLARHGLVVLARLPIMLTAAPGIGDITVRD